MTISILGIDIAKNTFQLHGADHSGKTVYKKRLARRELAAHVTNLPPCTIVMEGFGEQKCADHLVDVEFGGGV